MKTANHAPRQGLSVDRKGGPPTVFDGRVMSLDHEGRDHDHELSRYCTRTASRR